jgi:hypothetical protein
MGLVSAASCRARRGAARCSVDNGVRRLPGAHRHFVVPASPLPTIAMRHFVTTRVSFQLMNRFLRFVPQPCLSRMRPSAVPAIQPHAMQMNIRDVPSLQQLNNCAENIRLA